MANLTIREEADADRDAVREVNRLAFGRDAEARLVDRLREGKHARLSFVAEVDGRVVAHILFSDLPILTPGPSIPALSLAPNVSRSRASREGGLEARW